MKLIFLDRLLKSPGIRFLENPSSGSRMFMLTDRRTDFSKLLVVILNFANPIKKTYLFNFLLFNVAVATVTLDELRDRLCFKNGM